MYALMTTNDMLFIADEEPHSGTGPKITAVAVVYVVISRF